MSEPTVSSSRQVPVSSAPLRPRRVAMICVHTSPLDRPGTGDAGGLNVYVVETARQLARAGVEVEIFTRATSGARAESVDLAPGVRVRHVVAGPYEGLGKDDLPGQLCAFGVGFLRALAHHPEGHYDLVHSHYWLSGHVGWLASERWNVPLVHTMHTMARVKNASLAPGDSPEPPGREIGEVQVVEVADRLLGNTEAEVRDLVELYGADPQRVRVVTPGVDLGVFTPGDATRAREAVGVDPDALVALFVGRIQRLKAPDLLVKAAALVAQARPDLAARLQVVVLGGPSGSGTAEPDALQRLVKRLGVGHLVRFVDPVDRPSLAQWYRAADVVAVPSHSESFGLVAVEAQACGTPVLAARVGGLATAVVGGVLLDDHEPATWASELTRLLDDDVLRAQLGARGVEHAAEFGWERTTQRLLDVYGEAMAQRRQGVTGQSS